ncbi:MAG: DUF4959 domain-containing protein [Prevotellaceae bacterium]|nr:DUF4959 domain-containing protein [Prevotellaceae bacterium]
MNIKKYLWLCVSIVLLLLFSGCEEGERFMLAAEDSVPPSVPTNVRATPLNGAARIYFTRPTDEDLMSIEAKCGENTFAVSFYKDSIDVLGLTEQKEYTISVCAVDKSGNRSGYQEIKVTPLESAISKIIRTFRALPGFNAFVVHWTNELEESVNIFVEYEFTQDGVKRELLTVFSSRDTAGFAIVEDLNLGANDQVKVKVSVGDRFDNRTATVDQGSFPLLHDTEIIHFDPVSGKNLWSYPQEWEEPPFGGGVVQAFGNEADGQTKCFIDGIIDDKPGDYNYTYISGQGQWNFLIDLGDYYELSRVILHGRHSAEVGTRGDFFSNGIGIFATYRWDEETEQWESIGEHKTLQPEGTLSDLQWYKLGILGHMHYLYPLEPKFTKPTRWFRFQALYGFGDNYTSGPPPCTSELRLFCKPK